MTKICTTIEQSQILNELGLDVNTADMYYDVNSYGIQGKPEVAVGKVWSKDIPAWSLSALLKLIPNWTMDKTDKVNLTCNPYYHCESCYDEPIDVVFEMICWLLKSKKI